MNERRKITHFRVKKQVLGSSFAEMRAKRSEKAANASNAAAKFANAGSVRPKDVDVFPKTCTSFRQNMYIFFEKHVHLFPKTCTSCPFLKLVDSV